MTDNAIASLDQSVDEEDGEPIWPYEQGDLMPGGHRAWERLGVGRRCEAWLVWSPLLWAPAVLKLARPHQADHPRAVRTLRREVNALHGNPHPVLPRLYADGTLDTVPWIALEYVDGPTLADELEDAGPLAADDVALLGVQLLTGLRAVHRRRVAHLDVKPDNIVLRDGRPVLIDFGSARGIGTRQPAGHPVGTLGYAAPEMEACEPVAASMDIYALAVTLREAWAGPDRGDARLGTVIDRLGAPDPRRRPSADAALGELSSVLPEDAHPWPPWVACG
ncbi:MAG TPA: serine/threonine-protein kinase [Actinoplanes sp.]